MRISVAICTWNRAGLLDRTLSGMTELRIPDDVSWELLVVNNNCADNTDAIIARHAGNLPICRLFEPTQGHSHARNCAIAAATGDYLLWTDDDVLVDPGWLSEMVAAACRWPDAVVFGGTIEPWFEVKPPRWVHRCIRTLQGPFAVRQLGDDVRPLTPSEIPFGANMMFRSECLKQHGFDTALGRVGDELISADDTEMMRRLLEEGRKGVWVGRARVRHYIPAERCSLEYIWNWYCGYGRTRVRRRAGSQPEVASIWGAPRHAVRQYLTARLRSWLLAPVKGPAWAAAYTTAARTWGMIEESRALAHGRRQDDAARTVGEGEHR